MNLRLWPRSLLGQLLFAVALALLLVQAFNALLLYRAQSERRQADLVNAVAFRLIAAARQGSPRWRDRIPDDPARDLGRIRGDKGLAARRFGGRAPAPVHMLRSPLQSGEATDDAAQAALRRILADEGVGVDDIVVLRRPIAEDAPSLRHLDTHRAHRLERRVQRRGPDREDEVIVAGVHLVGGDWLVARVFDRSDARGLIVTLLWQTVLIYLVVVGTIALILQRISRPLAALTGRLEQFAATRSLDGQLAPGGPDDVRRLIDAHNAMEDRIAALLDEKDLMLGAIGHDLKTPLAALRVRIETVEDDRERERMASTIEDIVRTLDDILSLARVGRPTDPRERTELSALVAAVVEEFEDVGSAVELGEMTRIVVDARPTWLRRALRNLVSNAVRYGGAARVSLAREGRRAVVRIADDGPGIPASDVLRMMEAFTRGEASRNSETGGAGLGLALARAIADQHGGAVTLGNRRDADGTIAGLTATLELPID